MRRGLLAVPLLLLASACGESAVAPTTPIVARAKFTLPPPPPAGGFLDGTFSTITTGTTSGRARAALTFSFHVPGVYNRSNATGKAWIESRTTPSWFISSLNGATVARGRVVVIDSLTNNRWTIDIAALNGFVGQIFGDCQPADPAHCVAITQTLTGTVEVFDGNRYARPRVTTGSVTFDF